MRYAVLGCGPAGLFAAWAVRQTGHEVIIFSIKQRSRQYGAQWLHQPIPGLTPEDPESYIWYSFFGSERGYAQKVYDNSEQDVSWKKFGDNQPIWDLRSAYERAWDCLEDEIVNVKVDFQFIREAINGQHELDGIISTIPRNQVCAVPTLHSFMAQPIWAAVTNKHIHPVQRPSDNHVVYNGLYSDEWYRAAWVFGKGTIEYPFKTAVDPPKAPGLWRVNKPFGTDCDCWIDEERMFLAGRYGRWLKKELSHDSYYRTQEYLRERVS